MRGQAGRPRNEDYVRLTDSEDEGYFQEEEPARGSGPGTSSRGRRASRRRYSEAHSSDEDGDEYDDDLGVGRQSNETQRRARR